MAEPLSVAIRLPEVQRGVGVRVGVVGPGMIVTVGEADLAAFLIEVISLAIAQELGIGAILVLDHLGEGVTLVDEDRVVVGMGREDFHGY